MRAIRLGRASTLCTSCNAFVAEYTDALSPASSCASAAHSCSQAKTLSAAVAGSAITAEDSAAKNLRIVFILITSEFVGAMRAETHDVLEEDLLVGHIAARLVACELQPHAAELARAPVGHHRVLRRVVRGEDREIRCVERSRKAAVARIQPVISITDPPHRDELILALQLEVRVGRVVVRRPLQDSVQHPETA